MAEIKPEHYFYVTDGKVIKSLEELPEALEKMDNGAFYFHVNENRNDFANWIRDVFNKKTLANKLKKAKTKQETIDIVKQAIPTKNIQLKKDKKLKKKAIFQSLKH